MPTQIEQAEAQRQEDALAFRVRQMRENADRLTELLHPRGWWGKQILEAERRADQAAHDLARTRRERQEAETRLSELRAQIATLTT